MLMPTRADRWPVIGDPLSEVSEDVSEVLAALAVDTRTALDAAYRRLREACDEARRILLDSQPGPLPTPGACDPGDRWLLDEIELAERDVDRLRRLSSMITPALAARSASAGTHLMRLSKAARQQREATRVLGIRAS